MKRMLRVGAWVLGTLVLSVGAAVAFIALRGIPSYPPGKVELRVEPTPERVARGEKLVRILCAECHMNPTTRKLTGKRMLDAPAEFGPIFSRNITKHPRKGIGSWTDGELAYLLRTGIARDGRYIPPYMAKLPHLADEDLYSVIAFLRSDSPLVAADAASPPGQSRPSFLTKFLSHVAFKPLPYPEKAIPLPDPNDKLALGKYLIINLECWACHSADFKTLNVMEPEKTPRYLGGGNPLLDLSGRVVPSANLTFDVKTGLGTWSEADFVKAMHDGVRPDAKPVLYPMDVVPELTDYELSAMYAYLKSVPKLQNAVQRAAPPQPGEDPGRQAYYKYGCYGCHGNDGVGTADLRGAGARFPDDASMMAWIANAPAIKPGTRMPKWEGIISNEELSALAGYVRKLGATEARAHGGSSR
jgi:mono/diheme cytochrome c family protein